MPEENVPLNLIDVGLPAGFRRSQAYPTTCVLSINQPTLDNYSERITALLEWASTNDILVYAYSRDRLRSSTGARVTAPFAFAALTREADARRHYEPEGAYANRGWDAEQLDVTCANCRAVNPLGTGFCVSCNTPLTCGSCGHISQLIGNSGLCRQCTRECSECGGATDRYHSICEECIPDRVNCFNCGLTIPEEGDDTFYDEAYGSYFCSDCTPPACGQCGRRDRSTSYYDELDADLCTRCVRTVQLAVNGTEAFEDEEKIEADMVLPTIEGREMIRRCGLEIEGGGREETLGRALFEAGLTRDSVAAGYHSASQSNESTYFSLEHDSSVDWELVSPPINLASRTDVRKLRQALRIIREQIKAGSVSLDMRCGLHIHVDAGRMNIGQAFNLGTVWGYLEDVIFRLGAAKWPKHRAIVNGTSYCMPTPKGAKTKLEFGRQLDDETNRYQGLSFNNWLGSMMRGCTCGAVRYDSWDNCTCELRKCTVEFRVFNSSANMHKIHAYLALCQALVAKAVSMGEVVDTEAFVAQTFVAQTADALPSAHVEDWKERLTWMFTELPLTDAEKGDLLYCVHNSELARLGEGFINNLAESYANEVQEVLV